MLTVRVRCGLRSGTQTSQRTKHLQRWAKPRNGSSRFHRAPCQAASALAPKGVEQGPSAASRRDEPGAWTAGDLLQTSGGALYTVESNDSAGMVLTHSGMRYQVKQTDGRWELTSLGPQLQTGALANFISSAFPGLVSKLGDLAGSSAVSPSLFEALYSLAELEAHVSKDSSLWCEGTKPGVPEKTVLQSETLTAGELLALEQGKRGLVIVQLWNGWDPSKGQPINQPYVLTLLQRVLAMEGVKCVVSTAPGGVGMTAVVYVDKEPWNTWGPHLASFGCQANAVAGNAYYKLLIGRMLGYAEDNVAAYIRSTGGGLTPDVIKQVDADMKRLSKTKPKLPWNRTSSRGKGGKK